MKTITIRWPDVEAAMLIVAQKSRQNFKVLDKLIATLVRSQYQLSFSSRAAK